MKEAILQNIDLSSQIIVFDQQNHQGELILTNKHASFGTVFKIKATKLNIIDVKPAKGFIKPQGKVTIAFKLSANMSTQQMQTTQNNDKFMIQFLNVANQQASKQEVENVWKAHKNGTANLQHGYGCYRVLMNLTGKRKLGVSDVKSKTANSQMYKSVGRSLSGANDFTTESPAQKAQNDEELSKKYTELKHQQNQLIQQRENIFKTSSGDGSGTSKGSKGNVKAYIVFLLVLILGFLAGNYLRSSMVRVKHPEKLRQEKRWYSHLPFVE